jgi:outer membrane protein insertion porin family
MKKILLFFIVALLAAGVGAEVISSKITGLAAAGNIRVTESEILSAVFSRIGETIDEEKLKNDLKAIYALGYFQDVNASFEAYKDGTRIIYQVKENPLLNQIRIEGQTVYSTREILSQIKLKAGDLLNYRTLREDIAAINDFYKKAGYTLARVVDVSTEKGEVNFKIVEGLVESVSLEGNDATQNYVILREMKTRSGVVFNEETFGKDLRRVFNLGFFSEINPAFEPGTTPDKMRIILKIKETRTNTINFGGGYGERDGWFGFVDLSLNNLQGTAQGLMLRGQSGQQLSTYQFKYYNPWFMPDRLGDRTSLTYRLWNTMGTDIFLTLQDEYRVGWDVTLGKTLRDDYSASFSLGSENLSPRGTATFEPYLSEFIGVSLSYDTRDFWLNPSKGAYHTFSVKQGWKFASLTTAYNKFGIDFNFYQPLRPQQVLAYHLGVGIGFGDVPLGELYWAGGANTVRGYNLSELRRGARRLLTNVEYRYTFNEIIQAVIFFDWGNSWNEGAPVPVDFMTGWGPGIRFNTPLGPIRLDYGVAGGRNFGEGVLHFSIGQAF